MFVHDKTQPALGAGRDTEAMDADCPCRPCYAPRIVFGQAKCWTLGRGECRRLPAQHVPPAEGRFCRRCGQTLHDRS